MRRTLLLLGGMPYLVPVIEEAHRLDCTVVTCDYLPGNHAHRFSDGYVNASIVDRDAVLDAARKVGANGIMSFAADPGVVSAAYAAVQLGLPGPGPLESVETLQNKFRFREFLRTQGFTGPRCVLLSGEELAARIDAFLAEVPLPLIVKPADLSGSRAVSIARTPQEFREAIDRAIGASRDGYCVVEEIVEGDVVLETDAIVLDGVVYVPLVLVTSFDERAPNPFVPVATTTDRSVERSCRDHLREELQRLCDALAISSGLLNVEARLTCAGELVLMEVSPRGGGGDVALLEHLAGCPNLIGDAIRLALGESVDTRAYEPSADLPGPGESAWPEEVWHHENVHSDRNGRLEGVWLDAELRGESLVSERLWASEGTAVRGLCSASDVFGSIFLRFSDRPAYERYRERGSDVFKVVVS